MSTIKPRGPGLLIPQRKFNNLFNKHFPQLILLKSILSRKNWRDGGRLLFKVATMAGYIIMLLL